MANRYWVGGTANWDATAGTKWAETSGGPGGFSVPTSVDDVFFDANSTGMCTVSGLRTARSINFTGFTGIFAGTSSPALDLYGSLTYSAGMTATYNGSTTFFDSATLTTAGKTFGPVSMQAGAAATLTLGDALNMGPNNILNIFSGTFTTTASNFSVTAASISTGTSTAKTINLNGSTVTLASSTPLSFTGSNLTFNIGTSTIICSGATVTLSGVVSGGAGVTGVNFHNVSFSSTSAGTHAINSINSFNSLSVSAPSAAGVRQVTFDSRQTIGTLSTNSGAGNRRILFRGVTNVIAQTLTINSAPSLSDVDFRDIVVQGTAAPISGTRIGNLRGCQGITFSAPKTVYWVTAAGGNWSGNNWAPTSGGGVSADSFPLAQDTAIIENTGLNAAATITMDSTFAYAGTVNMSTRTNSMTLTLGAAQTIYGNWINGSGTALSGVQTLTFSGRNTQTITSAGKTFSGNITIDSYGGTVELADALNSLTLTINNGTFDTKNFNVTTPALSSDNSNFREIRLGSSTVTLTNASTCISFNTATNLTFNAGTSQINVNGSGPIIDLSSTIPLTFYNLAHTYTGAAVNATISIGGTPTFNNLTLTPSSATSILVASFAGNTTITGTLSISGPTSVTNRVFIRSNSFGFTRTLTVNALNLPDCDFQDITIAGAAAGSSPIRAGDCGGNLGITFPSPKTVYWNLAGTQNWSDNGWALTSDGIPSINNFPLAQDNVIFTNIGFADQVVINLGWNIGSVDISARTTAMTLTVSGTTTATVYKDWKFGTGCTSTSSTGTIVFATRSVQTITSNGVQFGHSINFISTGTVQLADALSLNSLRTLTLTSGTFDAVTYNVTIGVYSTSGSASLPRTLKMGSGTWTLSGTGSVWSVSTTNFTFLKNTADIILSDTSTTARTFAGNGYSYNKLTIGGATGISTTTITGSNQFTELASTKTVAHTIALGSTTQTFGKWTVTGTVGNVVTLTGTGTSHVLAGPCTSGIDYLAMGSIGFAATSPGEFYAGVNSTGTASAPVYRTAKPTDGVRYWVGGTGFWSDTNRWSTASGGVGGASVPRSHDDVIFNSASGGAAYTATVDAVTGGVRTKSLTISGPTSGSLTLAGTANIVGVMGNVTLPATGLSLTYTGGITLSGSTTGRTFTTNGVILSGTLNINGVNCEWILGSALNISSSALTLTNGTFRTSTFNLTAGSISSDNINTRTYDFGSGTTTLSGAITFGELSTTGINLTVVPGTSQITFTNLVTVRLNGHTYNNVTFTWTTAGQTVQIYGNNTFNNLTIAGATGNGFKTLQLFANQTVTGTLTFSPGTNASMRNFCTSSAVGTQRTITAASMSMTDVDFQNIVIAGAASPASGTRIGNCGNNSGITFTPAANKYHANPTSTINWQDAAWSLTEVGGASINNFPLPQDTVIFTNLTGPTTGGTMIVGPTYNYGTIDFSQRTNAMTFNPQVNVALNIHGNLILGPGVTWTGGSGSFILFRGSGIQNITSSGKTINNSGINISPLGSVVLNDSLTVTQAINFIRDTLNLNGYNITGTSFNTAYSTSRTLLMNNGTLTLGSSSTVWDASTSTNLTVTGPGTIRLTSATAKTFSGGNIAYSGVTLDQAGVGALTISGNNRFKDITNSSKSIGATTIIMGTSSFQIVSFFTASGESGRLLTVTGTNAATPATLIYLGTQQASEFLNLTGILALPASNTWYADTNSTNNGTLGINFNKAPAVLTRDFFTMFS